MHYGIVFFVKDVLNVYVLLVHEPQYVLYCYKITSHLNSDKAQSYSGLDVCLKLLHQRVSSFQDSGANYGGS